MTKESMFEQLRLNLNEGDRTHLFYDWFCKESSLHNKSKRLMAVAKKIVLSPKFDATKTYMFFKNNCPISYPLYDDFRICDMETGRVQYTISPRNTMYENKTTVWGNENDFDGPLFVGTLTEMYKWFEV